MVTPRVTNRYPRPGERIAPYTLRQFLLEPLPAEVVAEHGGAELRLCDLDETAWRRFPTDVVEELAEIVLERISAWHGRTAFLRCRFPRPAPGVQFYSLKLENRTRRCMVREGFDEHIDHLGDQTIGDIMAIRAFGPRSLVDLLCALESAGRRTVHRAQHVPRDGIHHAGHPSTSAGSENDLSKELTAAARRLADLPQAEAIRCEDPRYTRLIRPIDSEARTAKDLADRLLARTHDPSGSQIDPERTPADAVNKVLKICDRIERMSSLTLEEELIQIFTSRSSQRNAEIAVGYYGWKDGGQHTLTEIGERFGITRERVRQVCAKATWSIIRPLIVAPVMDRVLSTIHERLPAPAAEIEAELRQCGQTRVGISLDSIATAAKLLGRTTEFCVVDALPKQKKDSRMAIRGDQLDAVPAIVDAAKKDVYFHGLATVEEIEATAAKKCSAAGGRDLVAKTVQLIEGFTWLDEASGWFRVEGVGKHGLPKMIDKLLAVAGEVTIAELRIAMGRNRRLWKNAPPEAVLLEFCRHQPGVRIEGDRIISTCPRDWQQSLTGVERKLVGVLKEHGPVMERGKMEDLCVADGVNRFSFHAFISWSPVIMQLGHSLYGLLGAEVTKRKLEEMSSALRATRLARRVLAAHGWTEDGKVWLSYRLSKAASTYAVITVPAALKEHVQGRFVLLGPDGKTIGVLATKDGRAWGLGAFLRQRGARIDDSIRLTLDLKERTATVAWSDKG